MVTEDYLMVQGHEMKQLQYSASHCEIVMAVLLFDNTYKLYLESGGTDRLKVYLKELQGLSFETLVELMNSKVESDKSRWLLYSRWFWGQDYCLES